MKKYWELFKANKNIILFYAAATLFLLSLFFQSAGVVAAGILVFCAGAEVVKEALDKRNG